MWDNNTIEDEIQRNSLEYGVSVNTDRSIPDAKSGLKPVARRIIYDAFIEGRTSDKPHVKCARIYGDVMGRFHPHGDSSIYGAMIRLSQDWIMRYPLIDVHGNNGTILGDGPAAGRYTEARLSKIAEEGLLHNLKKKNVDFIPNYDESEEEPITLPAIFPNLLCNPNEGIGWAMGCSWAPHNLVEVSDAIFSYLDGNEPMLPGPDFPTGGIVINKKDIPNIMRTGHGSVKIRGRYKIEKQNIIFYEIPYGTRLEPLMEEIGKASEDGKVSDISDIRNETGKNTGLRLVIEVDRKANPQAVVNQLFAKTSLQSSFSYNQIALIGKTPTELSLKDAIKVYVDHNIDCISREAKFDLNKAEARLEIVSGLLNAFENIDNIIALIKKSESAAAAKIELIKKYCFTENQAKAILDMKLAKLAKLEKVELEKEEAELKNTIKDLKALLSTESLKIKELKKRLTNIVNKFGDKRRTELIQLDVAKDEVKIEQIPPEDVVVVINANGNIKRVPANTFKTQHRGGKGKTSDDLIVNSISTNTQDYLLLFSNTGKLYRTIVDSIPTTGGYIGGIVNMADNEKVSAITSICYKNQKKYAIFITRNGLVKKTEMSEYLSAKRNGIAAIKFKTEDDSLASVHFTDGAEKIVVMTHLGRAIKFTIDSIPSTGRATMGVKGVKLEDNDFVIGAVIEAKDSYITVLTENGYGKRMDFNDFNEQNYGGKGVSYYNVIESTGYPISVTSSVENNKILITGKTKTICIAANEIPQSSKSAMGTVLIKNNKVTSITSI